MRKIFLLIFFSLATIGTLSAQSLRAYIKAADVAFAKNDYFTALVYYKKVLEVEPDRNDIHFKYAESARQFQAYRIAEDAYHKITLSKDSLNFPLATYWLGSVKKNLGKYEEAEQVLNTYLEKFKRVNTRFSKRAERDIVDCQWASQMVNSSFANTVVTPLSGGINTPYSEFGAIEVGEDVYFSSMRFKDKDQQMYSKLMMKNKDGVIESFDFNTDEKFVANPSVSFDGTRLYYTNCTYSKRGDINCEIVYRDKKTYGEWGAEQKLPSFINFPGFTATHPTIGYDKINEREILFFSSNRPGGKGKLDIWYSTVAPNGKLTRPINHSQLNTRENDVTPFFHSSSQTLYFSSDGYPGMGGYDIYKVKRSGRSWQTPVHLTYPINTSYNDFYFALNELGTLSYFSSNREEALEIDPEKEACCNDIFTANVQPDRIELTQEDYLALTQENQRTFAQEESDEPKVIIQTRPDLNPEEPKVVIKTKPDLNPNDFPETILNDENSDTSASEQPSTLVTSPENSSDNTSTSQGSVLNPKGEDQPIAVESELSPNNNSTRNSDTVFEEDFESLPKDLFSLIFEVEAMDLDLEPLTGVTAEFIEKGNQPNRKNFRKSNLTGNKIKFRIKDHVSYQVVLSKPGFETDTFAIDQESLIGSKELTLPFFLGKIMDDSNPYPDSPFDGALKEPEVTESMLSSFLPVRLYFNNNEPDPTSWSNSTNKNYEQTFLLYHSKKDRFKNQYARKFAQSQRTEALDQIDDFFENELKKGFQDLTEFSGQLYKYLEQGNKVTISLQAFTTVKGASQKNNALIERRISSIKNHFRTHLAGKLMPYLDGGFLEFIIMDPMVISTKTNGTYSPEASKLRKIEIKVLKFNDF